MGKVGSSEEGHVNTENPENESSVKKDAKNSGLLDSSLEAASIPKKELERKKPEVGCCLGS